MLLTEAELNLLSSLWLNPCARVRGQSLADFRSLDKGTGLEFSDYRDYMPGDDIRRLDLHQYQRNQRLVVRQYDQYESVSFQLVVDLSDSMNCGDQSKIQSAKKLCAAYAFLILKHGYKVSVRPVGAEMPPRTFSSANQWTQCLDHIEGLPVGGRREIADVLHAFCGRSATSESLILISDFICSKGCEQLTSLLSLLRQNVVYLYLYADSEINPSWNGDWTLVDSEWHTERPLLIDRRKIEAYKKAYFQYYDALRQFAVRSGHSYYDLSKDKTLTEQIDLLARDGTVHV